LLIKKLSRKSVIPDGSQGKVDMHQPFIVVNQAVIKINVESWNHKPP